MVGTLQMSDHEILYEYTHAANRAAQVSILADLNAVSEAEMREKLQALGAADLPPVKRGKPQIRRKVGLDECRAMELYNEGLCDLDMAETLGVSRKTVADWRKKNALKVHRQRPGYVQEKRTEKLLPLMQTEQGGGSALWDGGACGQARAYGRGCPAALDAADAGSFSAGGIDSQRALCA